MLETTCSIAGCRKPAQSDRRPLCAMHERRLRVNGSVGTAEPLKRYRARTPEQAIRDGGWQVDANGCWLFQGHLNHSGYGVISAEGKHRMAHRFMLEQRLGRALETNEKACHKCDVPACINPDHLFPGSQRDNLQDMHRKGRGARGTDHYLTSLTDAAVREMRDMREAGIPVRALAPQFGVSLRQAYKIVNREQWKHVS